MAKYRILSLDGASAFDGGGYVTVGLLQKLRRKSKDFLDHVDLFAGTSAGGWTALFLALQDKPSSALKPGKNGEDSPLLEFWKGIMYALSPGQAQSLGRMLLAATGQCALTSFAPLRDYFNGVFEEKKMGDLKHHVAVTSFQLDSKNEGASAGTASSRKAHDSGGAAGGRVRKAIDPRCWKDKIFHNFTNAELDFPRRLPGEKVVDEVDLDEKIADVAMRTGACPVLAPIVQGAAAQPGPGYLDGGVFANNPAMCALAQALRVKRNKRNVRTVKLEDIRLLSVGNGFVPVFLEAENSGNGFADWGYVRWFLGPPRVGMLINMFMSAGSTAASYQCRALLGERFLRFQPTLDMPVIAVSGEQVKSALQVVDDRLAAVEQDLAAALRPTTRGSTPFEDQHLLKKHKAATGRVLLPGQVIKWFEEEGWFDDPAKAASRRKRK